MSNGENPASSARKKETSSHQATSVVASAATTWGRCGRHVRTESGPLSSLVGEPVLPCSPQVASKVI